MKRLLFALLVLACSTAPCEAAGLQLSIADGKVSIDAQDVTIRQILTEWARVGKTRIVNVERLSGGPITIKLDAVPEKQALETILRTVPGYIAATRQALVANASLYDTIVIMPTTTAVAAVRMPNTGSTGMQGGFPGGGITALKPPMFPGMMPDMLDPASDQMNDPAIAAAAAAGLMPVPAMVPGPGSASNPLMMPGGMPAASSPNIPAASTPSPTNPWNAPAGTAQPSLPLPPQPADTQPTARPRPPVNDP